jgi:iron(III) transport system permease protein
MTRRFATAILFVIVGLSSGLPLAWMLWHLITRPEVWSEFHLTEFRLDLLGRTLGYNLAAAVIATLLALPAALVLGRGRGVIARLVWFMLPISLFVPSIVYSYGWSQFLRLLGRTPDFQSAGDVMRCIWSLATWLSPLPAGLIGLALRNVDANLQQQATMDGALWRITLRQLAGPIAAAVLLCTVLAVQEFSVYEPTGISVIATEVRMVFDTGAVSSPDNPITAPISGETAATIDQRSRAAAAVATAAPMLLVIFACAIIGARLVRGVSAADAIDHGPWPGRLNAGVLSKMLAVLVIGVTLGVPLVSLERSLVGGIKVAFIWDEFSPPVLGSLLVGAITGGVALLIGAAATAGRSRAALIAGGLTFLIGGQLLAIALIRLYNRDGLTWVYDSMAMVVFAYLARFGWIAIAAGRFTTSPRWRELRDMAAIDGAAPGQTATQVVLPLAWPILAAAAVCVTTLAITEVPATVLLSPQRPQMLTPEMMTWVHTLRFDPMIEASLLMVGVVAALSISVVLLSWIGVRTLVPRPLRRYRVG